MSITSTQIAALAGVSRGTVDRVLNNRGRVAPDVAERVRKIADEHDYRPNRAGRQLALARKPMKIGVILQSVETPFMQSVYQEMEHNRAHFQTLGAQLVIRTMDNIDAERQEQLLGALLEEGIDALAISPAEDERVRLAIVRASEKIPVVTFNADIPDSKRMCYVGQDNYASGRAGAGLLQMLMGEKGKVFVVAGSSSNQAHRQRLNGFMQEINALKKKFPQITVLPPVSSDDRNELASYHVHKMLTEQPDITGIFIAANGQEGTCKAVMDLGMEKQVYVVCFDRTAQNAEYVKRGVIDFVIDQDAQFQAVQPLTILVDRLMTDCKPAKDQFLARIDMYNKYNID